MAAGHKAAGLVHHQWNTEQRVSKPTAHFVLSLSTTCRFRRLVDADGLGVGVAVEAAPLQEQVPLPDVIQFTAEGAALGKREGADVHRLEGEGHLGLEVLEVEEQDAGPVQDGLPGEVLSLQQHLQLPLALGEVIPRQVDEAGALLEHTEIHSVFEGVSGFELELPKNQFDWS